MDNLYFSASFLIILCSTYFVVVSMESLFEKLWHKGVVGLVSSAFGFFLGSVIYYLPFN